MFYNWKRIVKEYIIPINEQTAQNSLNPVQRREYKIEKILECFIRYKTLYYVWWTESLKSENNWIEFITHIFQKLLLGIKTFLFVGTLHQWFNRFFYLNLTFFLLRNTSASCVMEYVYQRDTPTRGMHPNMRFQILWKKWRASHYCFSSCELIKNPKNRKLTFPVQIGGKHLKEQTGLEQSHRFFENSCKRKRTPAKLVSDRWMPDQDFAPTNAALWTMRIISTALNKYHYINTDVLINGKCKNHKLIT